MALKVFERAAINAGMWKQLRREASICLGLVHPGVVRLHDVAIEAEAVALVFEQASGGDLMDKILHEGPLKPAAAQHVFRQLVGAVGHCHTKKVYHADLKPENILLLEREGTAGAAMPTVKIADFGLARDFTDDPSMPKTIGKGTIAYMPPEVYSCRDYDPAAVDRWGLGVTLHLMVTRHPPFPPVRSHGRLMHAGNCKGYNPLPWQAFIGPPDGPLAGTAVPPSNPRPTQSLSAEEPTLQRPDCNPSRPPLALPPNTITYSNTVHVLMPVRFLLRRWCAVLLAGMLNPDPTARLSLEQITASAWVQGGDGFVPAVADAAAEAAGAAAAAALQWPAEARPLARRRTSLYDLHADDDDVLNDDVLSFDTGNVLDLGAARPGGLAVFAEDDLLTDDEIDGLSDKWEMLA